MVRPIPGRPASQRRPKNPVDSLVDPKRVSHCATAAPGGTDGGINNGLLLFLERSFIRSTDAGGLSTSDQTLLLLTLHKRCTVLIPRGSRLPSFHSHCVIDRIDQSGRAFGNDQAGQRLIDAACFTCAQKLIHGGPMPRPQFSALRARMQSPGAPCRSRQFCLRREAPGFLTDTCRNRKRDEEGEVGSWTTEGRRLRPAHRCVPCPAAFRSPSFIISMNLAAQL